MPKEGQQPPMPEEWVVAQSALRYAGMMKDEPTWPVLINSLQRRPEKADATMESLMSGGMAILGMSLRAIGWGAADGFSEWGDHRAFQPLVKYIEDPKENEQSRLEACAALAWVAKDEDFVTVAEKIKQYSGNSPQDQVRQACFLETLITRPIAGTSDALIGLLTGWSASLSAPDVSALTGSSAPKSAAAGLAAEDDIGSADADTARASPSGAASDALAGACVLRGRGIERLARALRCAANAASMSIDASVDLSIDALIGLLTGSASFSASELSTPDLSASAGSSAPKSSSAPAGLAADDIGPADADTARSSLVSGDLVSGDLASGDLPAGDAPLDATPLTSPSSWTGVLMKHLPCPTHHGRMPSRAWPLTNPAQRRSRSWLHLTKSLKRRSRSSSLPGTTPRRLLRNSLN